MITLLFKMDIKIISSKLIFTVGLINKVIGEISTLNFLFDDNKFYQLNSLELYNVYFNINDIIKLQLFI